MAVFEFSTVIQNNLMCPSCHSNLESGEERFTCTNSSCRSSFVVLDGIPVLIDDRTSIFSQEDFIAARNCSDDKSGESLGQKIVKLLPSMGWNLKAKENCRNFLQLLHEQSDAPRVLVIGGGTLGDGVELLAKDARLELIETDVFFGSRTMLICDAHSLPFKDETFDGVIIQAVLEHVVDPYACAEEIHRVIRNQGVVYAETPFMQQVHMTRYDFTRFTHLGHRRLFRRFDEIESGATSGPGTVLAWAYAYFLLSFSTSPFVRKMLGVFYRCTSFYLKYFDYLLLGRPGVYDDASGYYFIGRKGTCVLSDRELIKLYKGVDMHNV